MDCGTYALEVVVRFRHDGQDLLAGLEDGHAVAGDEALDVLGGPLFGGVLRRLAAAGVVHAGGAVEDEDHVAVGPRLQPRQPIAAPNEPGEGQRQQGQQGHAQQHEQDFFDEHAAPRHLAHLEEAHGPPVHDFIAAAVEQVDDDRNGQGGQTEQHQGL